MNQNETIGILLYVFAYNHALKIAEMDGRVSAEVHFLLNLMTERRELNVDFIAQNLDRCRKIEKAYQVKLLQENLEKEQVANYIMDLEAKVRNQNIIDFVRSVSPILYRLFTSLLEAQVPELWTYIHNSKNDQYDTWKFDVLQNSSNPVAQTYVAQKRDSKVTSQSLVEFLELTDLPADLKQVIKDLRKLEKSVRNPLAHLIKTFDEEELARTTGFSSQDFLEKIIVLAEAVGVNYEFNYLTVNQLIKDAL